MKIFVSRTDRLGDVMMALPALKLLRDRLPSAQIEFACAETFKKLLEPFFDQHQIVWVREPCWDESSYDVALFLNAQRSHLLGAWKARVPVRVGNRSRWFSFFCLTHSLRQKRSLAERNEGQYTLELAAALLKVIDENSRARVDKKKCIGTDAGEGNLSGEVAPILLGANPDSAEIAEQLLQSLNITGEFVVLHPGMGGGSALNLSGEKYWEVVEALQRRYQVPVVLSEGPAEADQAVVSELERFASGLKVIRGQELSVVAEVFRKAKVVVAPSTGPLHVAHYVGTATIGLYSPVLSQRPKRWAVWGGTGQATTLSPAVDCPGKIDCVGSGCPYYLCMENLAWGRLILDQGNGLN